MPLSTEQILALIARITAGERELFSQIVNEYNRPIFQFLWRQIRDENLATELTQETFVKVFNNLRQYRGDAPYIYWIRRIAQNSLRTFYSSKRGKELRLWESMDSQMELIAKEASPEQQASNRELLRRVRKELWQMDSKQAEVIRLAIFNDQSTGDVAKMLNIPEGTVLSRLNRGLKSLLKRLSREDHHE